MIEAEAAAAERARLAEAVRGLPRLTVSGRWMARDDEGDFLHRAAVLALLEDHE